MRFPVRDRRGFTLIELLIVVVVIGILAAMGVARFDRVKQRSYVAAMQSDLHNLAVKQEDYHMTRNQYASNLDSLNFQTTTGVNISINSATNTGWAATATHVAKAGIQCGLFVGTATASDATPATQSEVVACQY